MLREPQHERQGHTTAAALVDGLPLSNSVFSKTDSLLRRNDGKRQVERCDRILRSLKTFACVAKILQVSRTKKETGLFCDGLKEGCSRAPKPAGRAQQGPPAGAHSEFHDLFNSPWCGPRCMLRVTRQRKMSRAKLQVRG